MRHLSIGLAVILSLSAMGCGGDDGSSSDTGGAVSADEAQIEVTFTGDGTSFVGDREIVEGAVTFTFSNESDGNATLGIIAYETGSNWLAGELEFLSEEGDWGIPPRTPSLGYRELEYEGPEVLVPGSYTFTLDLEPSTYLFDVGGEDYRTTGVWRAAIIEVVAE